jgi:hypothetical protein
VSADPYAELRDALQGSYAGLGLSCSQRMQRIKTEMHRSWHNLILKKGASKDMRELGERHLAGWRERQVDAENDMIKYANKVIEFELEKYSRNQLQHVFHVGTGVDQ